MPEQAFCNRSRERDAVAQLLQDVRNGQSGALVVVGEPGVGKSALLRYVVEQAPEFQVAHVAGVESEMELPYAGLHRLCAPLLAHLDELPAPQQRALGVALGLIAGDAPDRFLVALATLTLLAEGAEKQPLLCFVDDTQWLDGASRQVLGFVARRLLAESVVIVFALRDGSSDRELAGLPQLRLEGLAHEDACSLLATVLPGRIDERVRDQIVAETRGNPLALLELPLAFSPAQLAGGFGLPNQPLAARIEESFLRRLDGLSDETRLLALVAAAEPLGDPALMWRAASELGVAGTTLEPATGTGLLDVGARVRFRHPLVRSAIYRAATEVDRRRAHGALASATDAATDPDRRAWHRAHATSEPDEEVAAELEQSAGRAQDRGGIPAAAAFLGRAADLTTDPLRRAERLLAAAQANLRAGAFDKALGLLAAAEAGQLDELARVRVDLLRAEVAFAQNRGNAAPPLLLRAARALEPLDIRLSRETYLDAWGAALFAGDLAEAAGLHDVSAAAARAPRPASPRPCDQLLDGFALVFTRGRAAATPVLQRAIALFAGADVSVEEVLRWGWLATAAAVYVWDHDTSLAVASREAQLARDSGALEVLAVAVNVLGQALTLSGDLAGAEQLMAEANAVTEATGAQVGPYGALVLAGFQGREAAASRLIATTIERATPGGQGTAVQYAKYGHALLMNGLGRYHEASESAAAAADDTPELFVSAWALSELVEAATRSGQPEQAADALERLRADTEGSPAEWARAVVARSRALVEEGEDCDGLYREAIERLRRTQLYPELARTRLLYGEWLRRASRRVDARAQLRSAHHAFAAMGAEGFADRARRELLATGERVRGRRDDARDELTHQEEHIARLAREGLTNPEIGAQLFLSPRTVEWHLRKVFTKLGISSRRGLADALPERPASHAAIGTTTGAVTQPAYGRR